MDKFYITTPIYYVNDRPHIGHAHTTVTADVLARWQKAQGNEVFFLTGTDEHGAKVEAAAKKSSIDVRKFVDEKAEAFKETWQKLNIGYDNFLRTTDPAHETAVSRALQTLYDKEFIYKRQYEGLYCRDCEQYKTKDDLIDGKCPDHQTEPEILKEESYFFKLSQFEKILKEKIEKDEFGIKPIERKNEALSFINQGLKDISISRKNVAWGILLPFDRNHTVYVWVDALLNYLTGLGWKGEAGKAPDFFPPDIQLMSKDILRVHATIWPALLLALELPLPKKIFVHGYFTADGQKMSKSLGNVIWSEELVNKFGVDGVRYLLMSSLSYGQDSDVSWEKLKEKYNADLANGLGNLISRIAKLSEKFHPAGGHPKSGKIKNDKIQKLFEELRFKDILDEIWSQIAWANKYIEERKLWELVKNNPGDGKKVLEELLSLIEEIGKAIEPFMPQASRKIAEILKTGEAAVLFPRV